MEIKNNPSFTGWYKLSIPQNVDGEFGQKSCERVFSTIVMSSEKFKKGELRFFKSEPSVFINVKDNCESTFHYIVNRILKSANEIFEKSGVDKISLKKIQPDDYEDIFKLQSSKSVIDVLNDEADKLEKATKKLEKEEQFKKLTKIPKKEYIS